MIAVPVPSDPRAVNEAFLGKGFEGQHHGTLFNGEKE
jgi:hypothetical protein